MITKQPNIDEMRSLDDYLHYVPYDVSRDELYDADTLYAGFDLDDPQSFTTCHDALVYDHFMKTGKHAYSRKESLARSLHDFGINKALDDFLTNYNPGKVIGIMGGHGLERNDRMFREIVLISKRLTERGYLMVSGGGPGAMEATHVGAWMAGYAMSDVEAVLYRLAQVPTFHDPRWLYTAFDIIRHYPQTRYKSLGIPTWLYGHEPATPFATHIAKFFDNAIREDTILTIAFGGIVFTPGSAGTVQEIFQEAVQNHYLSYGVSSPMIFLGQRFWTEEMPIYTLLKRLSDTGRYKNLILSVTDSGEEAVSQLTSQAVVVP